MSKLSPNENQKKAITYDGKGPLIIEAGPGSGKTRVLTERVKFLLNEKKVEAESLLIITFSRKATEELKNRLAEDIEVEDINKMQISTIHSFCYDLLKKYDNFSYEVLDDDYNQKKTLFIQKHLPYLGFKNISYLPKKEISGIINKFDEYSTFKVNTDGLLNYIEDNRSVSDEYQDLIKNNSLKGFPYSNVIVSDDFKKDWYNAKYYQTAKAYPRYLKKLNEEYLVDFNTLQIKALEFLEKNPNTIYKNILIDEFQDTDPVQYLIFEKLIPYADSFTVVGDVDQSIYGFRGGLPRFINELMTHPTSHVISLDTNYRSTENIVKLTEDFIKDKRDEKSQKDMKHNRKYNNKSHYIISDDKKIEAANILNYIQDIKNQGIVDKYSDIAILLRAIRGNKLKELLPLFDENNIPYNVKNSSTIDTNDDIKSLITILHYIIPPYKNHIFSSVERDWLNLKAFTGEKFTPTLWNLSDETCELLNNIEKEFEQKALETIKDIYKRETGKNANIRSFNGIFNNKSKFAQTKTDDMMIETFEKVPKPQINSDLINNTKDKEFFQIIESLRDTVKNNVITKILNEFERIKIHSKDKINKDYVLSKLNFISNLASKNNDLIKENFQEMVESLKNSVEKDNLSYDMFLDEINLLNDIALDNNKDLTVLDIFYKILEKVDYFNKCDEKSLNNFSLISESIYNFEQIIDNTDVVGYYNFLINNMGDWEEKSVGNDEGVQIMTIHKSKGLEFPVVIIPSVEVDKFPKAFVDESEKDYIFKKPTYFTPNEFLEYKDNSQLTDSELSDLEEERILYVAMTRAQDTVLLSFINDIHPLFSDIVNNSLLEEFNISNISKCESSFENEDVDTLNASYTSFKTYGECPFKYNLLYELKFKLSDTESIRMGTAIHNAFNKINVAKIKNQQISKKSTDDIITDIVNSTSNIPHDDEGLEEFKNNIYSFYDKIGDVNILESEYNFDLNKNGYNIIGSIDLILEKDGEISIIDFKNTEFEGDNIHKYKNQLKLYLHALSLDSRYNDKYISKAGIYAIKSDNLIMDTISSEEVDEYIIEVDWIAKKILDKDFEKNPKFGCDNCKFEFICESNQ